MINKKKFLLLLVIFLGAILRLYNLTNVPPALHGDELGIGFNAYSILKTGKDEYGRMFPLSFRNDFTPLIVYLTIPFTGLLGLSELAVRLPTTLVSVFTLPLIYYAVSKLSKNKKLSLLTVFLVSISTWDIRIARIGVGITLPLFCQIAGLILFLKSLKTDSRFLILSFYFFSLSLFTYQTPRITTPLLLILLYFSYSKQLKKNKLSLLYAALFTIFIIFPSLVYILERPIKETRFAAISIFTLWKSYFPDNTTLINYISPFSLLKLALMFFKNYLSHFRLDILFTDNSMLRYHQLSKQGLFYLWQSLFLVLGFLNALVNFKNKVNKFLLGWLFISPIPSSLTTGVPEANVSRALMMLPVILIFTAKGILLAFKFIRVHFKNYFFLTELLVITLSLLSFKTFVAAYYFKEPEKYEEFWGKHLKTAVQEITNIDNSSNKIIFSTRLSPQSYMYVLFYTKINPQWLLENRGQRAEIVGYSSFGNYEFRPISWQEDKNLPNSLIIGTPEEIPDDSQNIIREIFSFEGEKLIKIVRT